MFLSAGYAYVEEASLFLQLLWVAERSHMGKDPVFETNHEHGRVFESLGIVKRHQRHRACVFV